VSGTLCEADKILGERGCGRGPFGYRRSAKWRVALRPPAESLSICSEDLGLVLEVARRIDPRGAEGVRFIGSEPRRTDRAVVVAIPVVSRRFVRFRARYGENAPLYVGLIILGAAVIASVALAVFFGAATSPNGSGGPP
jgi:hypothetical protein